VNNLVKARGYIVFIVGLAVAFGLVLWVEQLSGKSLIAREPDIKFSTDIPAVPVPRPLTALEHEWALTAWRYFENNTQGEHGLVNSVANYPATTMWDTASYLLATICARQLDLLSEEDFDKRIAQVLVALETMPLFADELPNKSYSTVTLAMVDYTNQPVPRGIGWSAIDIGRLLVPMNILVWKYPQHASAVGRAIGRWNTARLASHGEFMGANLGPDGSPVLVQEGRLGYEQYAAKTFILMGLDATQAMSYVAHLSYIDVYDVQIPYDDRDPRKFGAHNYVVSEPYVLDGLEFGWDNISREFAWRVFSAQQQRFLRTGVLTAVTEDHLDQAPYFVYNTVFSDGKEWNTLTDAGVDAAAFRALSVKASFGWHALYRSIYTQKLIDRVEPLRDPQRGWYSGLYEVGEKPNRALNANTNAVVLESLSYIQNGKLIRYGRSM
jgi:hypothetical protein